MKPNLRPEQATDKWQAALQGHTDVVKCVAFSPDSKTLASASRDKTIKLWDVVTGKEKATIPGHTGRVSSVAYSPDGKTLASGSDNEVLNMDSPEDNKSIRLWVVATTEEWASPEGSWDYVTGVAYSPDGKTLASGTIG